MFADDRYLEYMNGLEIIHSLQNYGSCLIFYLVIQVNHHFLLLMKHDRLIQTEIHVLSKTVIQRTLFHP